jgi:hypothetical protein
MAQEIRKMPVRTKEIELTGDYAGWKFTGRINPPMSTLDDLVSSNFNRIIAGLSKIVLAWNFVDEEGQPLAIASNNGDENTMGQIPIDLAMEMAKALTDAITEVPPNS